MYLDAFSIPPKCIAVFLGLVNTPFPTQPESVTVMLRSCWCVLDIQGWRDSMPADVAWVWLRYRANQTYPRFVVTLGQVSGGVP